MDAGEATELEATRSIVRFHLGEAQIALFTKTIKEIMELPTVTPVPCAPPHVPGIVAVRGEALPLLDPARFLGLKASAPESPRLLIVRSPAFRVGLVCENVLGVIAVPASRIQEARVCSPPSLRRYALGEIELSQGVAPVLDLDALLADGRAR